MSGRRDERRARRRGRPNAQPDYALAIPVVRGALALAALFFPRAVEDGRATARIKDALFFLSGQVDKWSRWAALSAEDKALVARLLRWRPVEMANRTAFTDLVDELIPDHIADFRILDEETVLVEISGSARLVVEECAQQLWLQREMRPRRAQTIANDGEYVTWIRGLAPDSGIVEASYTLAMSPKVEPETPIELGSPGAADEVAIPVDDLFQLAGDLDTALGQQHRTKSMTRIFTKIQADPDNRINGRWVLRAGATRLFNAPTGVGKNVLAELVACWCAQRRMVTSLLVPKNAVVVQAAHSIETSLRVLGIDGEVVPLMSPSSIAKEAEAAATSVRDGDLGEWAYSRMHYGCALPAAAHTERAVDAWDPGAEPCTGLRKVRDDGTASSGHYQCPWKPSCGKFRLARQACRATVVVTSHINFFAGRLHVPVMINGRIEENPAVENVLLHRSHVVLIDEIDAFQSNLIGHSAHGLQLAKRRGTPLSPLRQFDREFNDGALGRIGTRIEGRVHAALTQARFLAENYNRHLAAGHFRRSRNGISAGHPMFGRWLLPRRWDAWLAATLFNLPEGTPPGGEHYDTLEALFPLSDSQAVLPEWLEPVAHMLALMTSPSRGDDLFDDGWQLIFDLLARNPYESSRLDDENERAVATDRLIRRAHLEPLRKLLFTFVYTAPQLHASGVQAAGEIASALGQYATWRAVPYGPMGRVLFAFTEMHDEDRPLDTALRVSGFGGDPHAYVATLGELTALAHTGRPRIVVGLSATGYFPGAPHHHVRAKPTWWVPDDTTGGIRIHAAPVSDEEKEFLRVSGTYGIQRSNVLLQLGKRLWTKRLDPALAGLASDPATAHRARLLLATTAYQGAHDLARGIAAAGVPAEHIVLAVPPSAARDGIRVTAQWVELPANRLEEFGRTVGTAPGSVLLAPLARAERGLNIVDEAGRSLIGSVWLVVRPIPILDEPAELLAHVHSRAHAEATPTEDPAGVLDLMRITAAKHFDELFASLPYFRSLPSETQLAIAKETLNGLIQLAGRARRGGDIGEIHLVDYAFHDTSGKSDLPSLVRRIRAEWKRDGHLDLMHALYGQTLDAIFDFADERQELE
ncbi:hypothetical protein [Haloechinothrix salitolerans]|uniref:Helicase ATP-binding domain-containing protein n=1 Tax=Haloechinothrix salitolerans TaxID=926830 RepID=A0ABW2BZL7_9PSEU